MAKRAIGIVIEGATGRLGATQHLRSLMAIRGEGGLPLANGDRLVPEPVLLGRNPAKLAALAAAHGGLKWSTERDACLADPEIAIYFDASATGGRPERADAAIAAGKHVYLEKPIAETLAGALDLARRAERAGLKNGVVQDKLFLPGLTKLRKLYEADFFGRVLSVRLDFGWWVFDGELYPAQRPSWNYRKATGGGLVLDMFAHWRYIFDRLLGEIKAVSCRHMTAHPQAPRRERPIVRCRCRGPRLRDLRARGRSSGAGQLVLGEPRQARRPLADPGRRHPGLGGVRAAPLLRAAVWWRRRSRSSTRNGRSRWSSTSNGRSCRMSSRYATATGPAGSCSSGTSRKMRPFRHRCSKAPRVSSSPRPAIKATGSAAGSICSELTL